MATLIIRMPSRAAADQVEHWTDLPCSYACPTPDGGIAREGLKPLSALATDIGNAHRLVLIIAASDVTVLNIKVPPLSAAQLQRALPSLVEDSLLTEPSECVIASSPVESGMCTVAVVQQIWLELLSRTVNAYGATAVVAVPAQLCVRHEPGIATALLSDDEREVTLKTSSNDGIGLPVDIALAGDDSASLRQVFALISAMTPDISTRMYVPPSRLGTYQAELDRLPEFSVRIALLEDGWKHWIKSIGTVEMNLLAGAANAARAHRRDWRSRRLLVALALLVPLVNIAGLNAEWLDLQQQADRLRNGMMQAYRTAYPQDKVVVDPLLQMQRHVTDAGRNAGNAAPDDFLALLARFGDAWRGVRPDTVAATFVTRLDYRERSLTVSLQPGNAGTMEKLQAALAAQGAAVVQTGTDSWQIRSRP